MTMVNWVETAMMENVSEPIDPDMMFGGARHDKVEAGAGERRRDPVADLSP